MNDARRLNRIWYIAAALLALTALFAGIAFQQKESRPPELNLAVATLYPPDFRPLAAFSLTDRKGQPFSRADLEDHWNLLFFGYTACPDVCPMTLYTLQQVNTALEQTDRRVRVVFVSVDPNRDTPEKVDRYVDFFNPDFIGLTGSHEALEPLTGSLGVFYTEPRSDAEAGYVVDHSAGIFLIGPDGNPKALFSTPHHAEDIAQDLLTILDYYD